jgi:hypothetical protein
VRRTLLTIAVLTLALGACELRAEIALNDDGSGTVGMVFAAEPEMLQLLSQPGLGGGDPFADLRADLADDPVDWKVEGFTEGRLTGIRATFAFASVEDLTDKMEALDSDAGGDAAIKDFSIARRGGGWVFEARSGDPQDELSSGAVPVPVDQLAALLKVQFRVTLPGSVASHNADEVTSRGGRTTFVWRPDLSSPPADLRAATVPGGTSAPAVPVTLGLVALTVVAFVWFRRTQSRPAVLDPNFSVVSEVAPGAPGIAPNGGGEASVSEEEPPVSS